MTPPVAAKLASWRLSFQCWNYVAFALAHKKYRLPSQSMLPHRMQYTLSHKVITIISIDIDSFTVFLHSPNGRHLPAVRAVQGDCQWPLKMENSHRSREPTMHCDTEQSQPIFIPTHHKKGWCQPHNPTDSPYTITLWLFNSLAYTPRSTTSAYRAIWLYRPLESSLRSHNIVTLSFLNMDFERYDPDKNITGLSCMWMFHKNHISFYHFK